MGKWADVQTSSSVRWDLVIFNETGFKIGVSLISRRFLKRSLQLVQSVVSFLTKLALITTFSKCKWSSTEPTNSSVKLFRRCGVQLCWSAVLKLMYTFYPTNSSSASHANSIPTISSFLLLLLRQSLTQLAHKTKYDKYAKALGLRYIPYEGLNSKKAFSLWNCRWWTIRQPTCGTGKTPVVKWQLPQFRSGFRVLTNPAGEQRPPVLHAYG